MTAALVPVVELTASPAVAAPRPRTHAESFEQVLREFAVNVRARDHWGLSEALRELRSGSQALA